MSVAICAYKFYSTKKNEDSLNSDNDNIILTDSEQNFCFENKEIDDLVSTLRSKKTVSSDKDSNEDRHQLKISPKKVKSKSSTNYCESVNLSLHSLNDANSTSVSSNNSALVENDNNALDDDYLEEVFDEIFYNRRDLLVF